VVGWRDEPAPSGSAQSAIPWGPDHVFTYLFVIQVEVLSKPQLRAAHECLHLYLSFMTCDLNILSYPADLLLPPFLLAMKAVSNAQVSLFPTGDSAFVPRPLIPAQIHSGWL
jgi:hypothetical protein